MRNTRKIFVALVIVLAMMLSMATLFVSAADQPAKLYLTPNANWKTDSARFAAYFFGNGETWVSMTDDDGDGVYEVNVPTDTVYPNVIFCRMNPSATANNWNNKWNQTADLVIPTDGPNHFTVKEGTWDSGGGTWSTYGSSCLHTNLSDAATCTTPQTCLDCGDPVVSALGHEFNSAHLCTRCNEQATFTVAGSGAHMGTEWDTGNTANDMIYDAETGTYTKVYEKVAAGSYAFKVVRDHAWGTAYPSADKLYTVADAGSTVTITLKGTTVSVNVELPVVECNHNWSDATCDKPQICSECGQSQGEALGHKFDDGFKCSVCGFAPVYTVAGDNTALFGTAWDPTNTANKMSYDKESGLWTISYVNKGDETIWPNLKVCLDLGWTKCWGGAAAGQTDSDNAYVEVPAGKMLTIAFDSTTEKITFTISDPPHVHSYLYPCDPVCQECYEISNPDAKHNVVHVEAKAGTDCQSFDGNVEYWYCSYCGAAWLDEAQTQITNLMNVKVAGAHSFAEGKCSVCDEEDPDYVAPVNDKLINFSTWEEFAKETYTDGTIVKYNDIFTFIYSKNSRVDGSEQTFEGDLTLTKRLSFGGKTSTGAVPAKNALKITVDAPHIIKIWYVAGGDGRYFALMDSNGIVISETTKETTKNALYISELVIVEAGEYYLGVPADNNYIFQIELTAHEHSYSEAVTAPTCTEAGYTTHTCSCGHSYKDTEVEATGHSYADGMCTVCGEAEGVAPHEHEYVATVTEPTCTEAGYTTHTCSCGESYNDTEVAAKGHYYVRGACTACNLAQPGYVANNKVINFSNWEKFAAGKYADGDTVEYDDYFTFIYSAKSKLDGSNKTFDDGLSFTLRLSFAGETPTGEVPSKNALKITVDGPQTLKIWYVAGGDGRYFALMDSNGTILSETDKETTQNSLYIDEIAIPAAGVYYLGVPAGNNYIFQVQLDEVHVHSYEAVVTAPTCTTAGYTTHTCSCGDSYKDTEVEALGHTYVLDVCMVCFDLKPSLVIGENNVIVPELGYTFGMFYVSEAGTYEIVSNLGTTTCIFTTPIGSEGSDFSIAADGTLGASWWVFSEAPVELQPGLYYAGVYVTGEHKVTIGAPHEHSYDKGVCTICAEADPNYVPPHEHIFINGKCECGETDPEFVPPVDDTPKDEEPVELSFIEKIIKAITEFFAKISEFFKGLFAKK